MTARKLIIGYGNRLRADDGLGWVAAARLLASLPGGVARVLTVHQLTPELAEPVSEAELAIFIDAAAMGRPGAWECYEVKPRPTSSNSFGHRFDVPALLGCSQAVFGASPHAFVVSVTAESFAFQDHLSLTVESVLPEVVSYISGKLLCARC